MGDIHALAINGNLKGIKQALGNKRLLSSLDDEKGWSPLHYAANKSKAKIVQVILDAGINPNIKSKPPEGQKQNDWNLACLLYTSPSPRDGLLSRMPSSA